jgi:hypothetical protein
MGRMLKLLVVSFSILFLFSGGAWALNLGTDITIFDKRSVNADWYDDRYDSRVDTFGEKVSEDDEVEPNMLHGQQWDLEGFFLNSSTLSMVGGWNFKGTLQNYTSGDIFIDVDGNVTYGVNDTSTTPGMGYEYVIDIDWGAGTYNAYSLNGVDDNQFVQTEDYNSPESDPWQFAPDGSDRKLYAEDRSFTSDLLTDTNYTDLFRGNTHYYASGFDLSFIYLADSSWDGVFTAHFTMGCGNDNLMGHGTAPVPEPATMLLLGTGLIGIAGVGRKKLFKK